MIVLKLIVNYPKTEEGITKLTDIAANFRATLIIESINQLNETEETKQVILKQVIKSIKENNG